MNKIDPRLIELLEQLRAKAGKSIHVNCGYRCPTHNAEVGATKVQLLPFHQFGENKYSMLGRDYEFSHVKGLHPEALRDFRQVFVDAGIDAFF